MTSPVGVYRLEGVVLPDGRLIEIGGFPFGIASYAYNPLNNTFSQIPSVPSARMNPGAGLLPNGNAYAVGGFNAFGTSLGSMIFYNSTSNRWTQASATLSVPRSRLASTVLRDGRIFVAGGIDSTSNGVKKVVEISDATYSRFITVAPLVVARAALTAVTLLSGAVLVMGGRNTQESLDFAYDMVDMYNVTTDTWVTRSSMNLPRWGASAVVLPNGYVAVVGGCDGAATVGQLELYNPATDSWVLGAAMNIPREFAAVGLVKIGSSYCVNGSNGMGWTEAPTCSGAF
jgi:hypothetical protein